MKLGEYIKDLYELHPESKARLNSYRTTFDEFVGTANECVLSDMSLESLCDLDKGKSHTLSLFLRHLPVEEILKKFGDDALFWTYCMEPGCHTKLDVQLTTEGYEGINPLLSEKSRLSLWQHFYENDPRSVKKQYDLHMALRGSLLESVPLQEILRNNASSDISDKRLEKYGLHITQSIEDYPRGRDVKWGEFDFKPGKRIHHIYMDTPVGFALTYKEVPNAVTGFLVKDTETLFIKQFQSLRPYKMKDGEYVKSGSCRGIIPQLDWTQTLLDCTVDIAKKQGFSRIYIQSAKNNPWIKSDGDGEVDLPLSKAEFIYDYFAQENGFDLGEKGDWCKKVV